MGNFSKTTHITGFRNPTPEGVIIELNQPASLKTGTGAFKEFFISWDKIGEALIDGYADLRFVQEIREEFKQKD